MRHLLVLLSVVVSLGTSARADEALTQLPGLVREAISVPFTSGKLLLEAQVTRPSGDARFPLVVLSHGSPRSVADRPRTSPTMYSQVAIEFARRGWAVVSVVRRGYGRSQGSPSEEYGPCKNPHYAVAGRASAEDIVATVKHAATLPYVDGTRVLLAGVSAGGFGSLAAAAQQPPGVRAVLNFAGGRGSDSPDAVCREDALVDAFAAYGKTIRVPTLFLYAENDHFFGPKLARRFFAAFTEAGGTAEFAALPGFGNDGHALLTSAGVPVWRDRVDAFLRQHNLPTWAQPVAETMPALAPPPNPNARDDFERYLASSNFEKAFAAGATRGFAWVSGRRTPDEAARDALETCAKNAPDCRVYAINGQLAK